MTTTDQHALRQLDAEVATKIFGWRRIEWEGDTTPMGRRPGNILSLVYNEVPHFSTDIRDAWLVVEHMRDLWTEATEGSTDRPILPGSFRSFIAPFDDGAFFDVLHRNADRRWPWAFLYVTPEVICRAALAALVSE